MGVLDELHRLAVGGNVPAAKLFLDRVLGPAHPLADPPENHGFDLQSLGPLPTTLEGWEAEVAAAQRAIAYVKAAEAESEDEPTRT